MDPVQVISLDPYVLAFVKGNVITLSLALALMKGVALITPGTTDDKVVTLISNIFGGIFNRAKKAEPK